MVDYRSNYPAGGIEDFDLSGMAYTPTGKSLASRSPSEQFPIPLPAGASGKAGGGGANTGTVGGVGSMGLAELIPLLMGLLGGSGGAAAAGSAVAAIPGATTALGALGTGGLATLAGGAAAAYGLYDLMTPGGLFRDVIDLPGFGAPPPMESASRKLGGEAHRCRKSFSFWTMGRFAPEKRTACGSGGGHTSLLFWEKHCRFLRFRALRTSSLHWLGVLTKF